MGVPPKHPTVCNICGKETVILTTNDKIYGVKYGSGLVYLCTNCRSYVGVHKGTKDALGILSTSSMRRMRVKCHNIFDKMWKRYNKSERKEQRTLLYKLLAGEMGMSVEECHFGYFGFKELHKALGILYRWEEESKQYE